MNTQKTVDVVMGTYNGEKYLREQLDSIVSQTYPIHRLIVQDDCSTDNTVAILREYAARYPFIELHINEKNVGYTRNFETAVKRSTADFVAISDQDDVWFPFKIERQVAAIGDCNLCTSAYTRSEDMDKAYEVRLQHTLKALMFGSIPGHTMLLRREFAQLDGIWFDFVVYDWGLLLTAYFVGDHAVAWVDEPLNWHRDHEGEAYAKRRLQSGESTVQTGQGKYAAYLHGLRHYRRVQALPAWKRFYTYIYEHTARPEYRVEHRMARCLLSPGLLPLLRLCLICLRYRHETYCKANRVHGLVGLLRGFFQPLIFAYNNHSFEK